MKTLIDILQIVAAILALIGGGVLGHNIFYSLSGSTIDDIAFCYIFLPLILGVSTYFLIGLLKK